MRVFNTSIRRRCAFHLYGRSYRRVVYTSKIVREIIIRPLSQCRSVIDVNCAFSRTMQHFVEDGVNRHGIRHFQRSPWRLERMIFLYTRFAFHVRTRPVKRTQHRIELKIRFNARCTWAQYAGPNGMGKTERYMSLKPWFKSFWPQLQ